MKIKEKFDKNIAVLSLSGKMMGGPDTMAVHQHVKGLLADGTRNVVIDMKDIKWLNSSGLGVLIACKTSVDQAEGQLCLAGVTEKVQSLLMISHLITIFDTAENADRAVAALRQ